MSISPPGINGIYPPLYVVEPILLALSWYDSRNACQAGRQAGAARGS